MPWPPLRGIGSVRNPSTGTRKTANTPAGSTSGRNTTTRRGRMRARGASIASASPPARNSMNVVVGRFQRARLEERRLPDERDPERDSERWPRIRILPWPRIACGAGGGASAARTPSGSARLSFARAPGVSARFARVASGRRRALTRVECTGGCTLPGHMPEWQERITRETPPAIRIEHEARYARPHRWPAAPAPGSTSAAARGSPPRPRSAATARRGPCWSTPLRTRWRRPRARCRRRRRSPCRPTSRPSKAWTRCAPHSARRGAASPPASRSSSTWRASSAWSSSWSSWRNSATSRSS